MNIKTFYSMIFALFISLFLTSCKRSLSCELINVSTSSVEVSTSEKSGKGRKELGVIELGESLTITDWGWHTLQIQNGDIIYSYAEIEPLAECIEYRGWGPWTYPIFRAAFNPDGSLVLDAKCTGTQSIFLIKPSSVMGITTQSRGPP